MFPRSTSRDRCARIGGRTPWGGASRPDEDGAITLLEDKPEVTHGDVTPRRGVGRATRKSTLSLRTAHAASALVVGLYACAHLANHLTSLHSVVLHLSMMTALRKVYTQPPIETLLLACVAFQAGSGAWLVARGWAARVGRVAWLQALSGAYLAFFLIVHVAAVLYGRSVLRLDTNFYYAAAGLHVHPFGWFFAPYYFLAVVALFGHLGCALYWRLERVAAVRSRVLLGVALSAGVVTSLLITLSLAGKLESVEVPAEYLATYGKH